MVIESLNWRSGAFKQFALLLMGSVRNIKEDNVMSVRVGKLAPDFVATAYIDGDFRPICLSDYRGQWVLLYFYPGDFTFV
jgi:hypothetical protein